MFQFFRRRDTLVRWFLGSLLVLVCVMMVVTLIPGLYAPSSADDVSALATVAGEAITAAELQQQVQQMARNNRLPPNMLATYAPQLLNQMVQDKAGRYEARRLGLTVSDTELNEQLRQMPGLFPGGQFIGSERYRDLVEQRFGMNVSEFEEKLREGALADKLRRVVTDGVAVTDDEVDREYRRRNDKIKIDYVGLKSADFLSQVQLKEDDLKAFFERNRSRYTIPEKRRLRILYADPAPMRDQVRISEQEIQQAYERNKERFRVPDAAHVAHILLKTVGKTPQQAEELQKKAQELLHQARAGQDFAELAKKNSEDTGTQSKGGDLGMIQRGQTVPEFERVAFSLEPGQISDVIKTAYGLHILKVMARQKARLTGLEEVRPQLVAELRREKGERVVQETADRIRAALRRHNRNPDAVASELKLAVFEEPEHARGERFPQLGFALPLDEAAFKLQAGEVTDITKLPGGGLALARVEQIIPQRPAQLADIRNDVEREYRQQKAVELAQSRAGELAERARNLGSLKKAAESFKLKVETSEPLNREGNIPDLGPIAPAFDRKLGEVVGPLAVSSAQASFVYAIAEQVFTTPEERAKNRESLKAEMLDNKRNVVFQLYLESLKEHMAKEGKLRINEAAIKRFTRGLP